MRSDAAQFVDFHGDEKLQRRVEQLAEKANEGVLTEEDRAEYEAYVEANSFMAVLQAKAR